MALRLIEIILPDSKGTEARELLKSAEVLGLWEDRVADTKRAEREIRIWQSVLL